MGELRALIVAVGWVAGWWLLARPRGLGKVSVLEAGGGVVLSATTVSIIIPARNEEATLAHLLASLGPHIADAIVVDDNSSDATVAVARAAGARVISAGPLPAGWAGKPWACQHGADSSTADVLIFVDADVTFGAGGLHAVVEESRRCGGLVSVQPWHRCDRGVESLSALFNIVSLMGVGAFRAGRRNDRAAAAFGPVMACPRSRYMAIGGHASVRGEVVEDIALARRFRTEGDAVTCRMGRQNVSFRMYPGGLLPLLEGWTKNIAAGARRGTRPLTLGLIALWFMAMGSVATGGSGAHWPYLVAYAAFAGQLWWMLRIAGRFRWWAWALWPVPMAFFVAVFTRSALLMATGRPARWKGREIPTGR